MAYADYDYYKNTCFGTAVQEADFNRLVLKASAFLDYFTMNKARENAELDEIKQACCALAEIYQEIETAQALAHKGLSSSLNSNAEPELQSQTVNKWTKNYRSGGDSAVSAYNAASQLETKLTETAQRYLAHTGLLYRGRRGRHGYVSSCSDAI